jgi:hypothetical protein
MVTSGTYTGEGNVNLKFNGKAIVVKSEYGPGSTIIDCQSTSQTRGFTFDNNETNQSKVIGFTIKNGNANYAPVHSGGGIYVASSPTIDNCIIEKCKTLVGGGIQIFNPSSIITPIIKNCTFITDSATAQSGVGGAINCATNARPTIDNCTFKSNFANYSCGAISVVGYTGVDVTITSCVFYENYGDGWGGAVCADGPTLIRNCTFAKNDAKFDGAALSAMGDSSDVDFTRNIVAFNYETGIYSDADATISFSCNDFYENEGGSFAGAYNSTDVDSNTIFENPLFCDTANDNYYISSYSPCDEDSSKCGLLIGKYNNNCTYCCNTDGIRGDANGSGTINVSDASYLMAYLNGLGPAPPCFEEGDVNGSGTISIADVTYLMAYLKSIGPAPPACP